MPKTAVTQWDTIAANNTDIGGIGIQGTNVISNVDNAMREIMAQIATFRTAIVITGGSIDGTTVGATTRSSGAFTTLAANNTVTFTNGGSMTGTWSNLGTVTTIDLNGGTIDGCAIGAGTPFTGAFTTLSASGAFSLAGDQVQISEGGTGATTAATARTALGLAIGTNVQAWDADLDTWATKTAPSGVVVGTTDSQTLTNKTLTGAALNGTLGATAPSTVAATTVSASGTITADGGLIVRSVSNSSLTTSGGTGSTDGANIRLHGGSHASLASDIWFLVGGGSLAYEYDHSALLHKYNGVLQTVDGAVGAPAYSFTGAATTGIFRATSPAAALAMSIAGTESARITALGVLCGKTAGTTTVVGSGLGTNGNVQSVTDGANVGFQYYSTSASVGAGAEWYVNASKVGSITQTSTTTTYATSSDYRLWWKEGKTEVSNPGAFIDALKPYYFPKAGKAGFIAHEFADVSPTSVSGEKDAVTSDGTPILQQMQSSADDVMANIIAELQSLRARVAQLEEA